MANIAGSYDEQAEASGDFSPVPSGPYRAVIVESDVEDISRRENKGRCLRLTWKIEGGDYDNRLVWQRLNMWAENMGPNTDKVITIANQQFASIRQATGKSAPQDSAELHHIPCEIYVGMSKPREGFEPQNEIKSVKAVPGGGQSRSGPPPAQRQAPPAQQRQAPASNSGGGSAPWRQRATA